MRTVIRPGSLASGAEESESLAGPYFGQTCAGRYLLAIVAPYPQRGVWRAVTAHDMVPQAKRRYQQWRND